jgi:hypothetical protein
MKSFLLVVAVAVVGLFAWKKLWSEGARIESHYHNCMEKIGKSTVKIDINGPLPPDAEGVISAGEQSGAAVCQALHESCLADFNSKGCEALRFAF